MLRVAPMSRGVLETEFPWAPPAAGGRRRAGRGMSPMRAWTVDADDIQIADDLDATLLHRTPWIESFLELKRSDRFIVTATKGFGKTLLLKAKRIGYADGTAVCIPENGLLDKPIGHQ